MTTKFYVNQWVNGIVHSHVKMFYPTMVAKETGLSLQDVFQRLMDLVQDNQLFVKWEVRCYNYGCHRTLTRMNTPAEKLGDIIFCEFCGEEIEIDLDNVFPIFGVTDEFKKSVKEFEIVKKNIREVV